MAHANGAPHSKKALFPWVLPPIVLPSSVVSDLTPAQKKLLKYRRCNERQKRLNQLLADRALNAYRITMNKRKQRDPAPPIPELPPIMISEEAQIRENYLFMKKCVLKRPVVPIPQQWLTSMLTMVPQSLMKGRELLVQKLKEEVTEDYGKSMRRFNVRTVLKKPDVKGLEDEEEAPLPVLPLGLDFSSPWHKNFHRAKKKILSKLHIVHPTMKTLLDFGYEAFSSFLLVDFSSFSLKGPIDCDSLEADVSLSCSKAQEKILNTWYQRVIGLFSQKALTGSKLRLVDSFYNSVSVLMSNQLKDLLTRAVEAFVKLFDSEDGKCLPLFTMTLILEENGMEFYPGFQELEEAVLSVVDRIGQTLQNIPTVHSWLMGGTTTLDAELPSRTIVWATSALRKSIRDNLKGPKAYFENYVERYGWFVDGTAETQVERFEAEEHSFDEYTAFIDEFFTHKKEILSLPEAANFPMFCLNCEETKQGLASKADTFAKRLMDKIVANYRQENEEICREFEAIKERALKIPETTEEMIETILYVKNVKTKGIQDLLLRIKESCRQMNYFLDVFSFTPEDIAQNTAVILWPKKIKAIFDEHDDMIEQSEYKRNEELQHQYEKLMELDELNRSVTD